MLGFSDSEGHVEPAVSVRPCLKTHEIQAEVHHESNNSLNVCPVVEDEMDEEIMDDKEEQSEESRAVRVGQKKTVTPTLAEREEHERTHIPYRSLCRQCVAARASSAAHRGRNFTKAVEDDKDMKQVCATTTVLQRDQPGTESAKVLVSKDRASRVVSAHVVSLKGAVIDWGDPAMRSSFGAIGTLRLDNVEVRSGSSNRGCVERNRESSWVSWNVVRAFAGCRLTVERVH